VKSDSKLSSPTPDLSYWGITLNVGNGERARVRSAERQGAPGARIFQLIAKAINQVVFNGEFVPGNQWISPENFYYQKGIPIPKRDVAKARRC